MRVFRLAVSLLALGVSAAALAAPANAPNPKFTGSDLFNLEAAADPQISPDGKTIVYVRRSNDIMLQFNLLEPRPVFTDYAARMTDRDAFRRAKEIDGKLIAEAQARQPAATPA